MPDWTLAAPESAAHSAPSPVSNPVKLSSATSLPYANEGRAKRPALVKPSPSEPPAYGKPVASPAVTEPMPLAFS